jgi:cobalt/nickel transport system permease protein
MYDWILKKDNYEPRPDRDFFIDKSVLSIVSKISMFKKDTQTNGSFFYRLNPGLKFITTMVLILVNSFLRETFSVLLVFAYLSLSLALLDINEIKKIVSICFFAVFFSAMILLPSAFFGNLANSLIIIVKVVSTVIAINIFAYTTKTHQMTKAIKMLRIPDIFILIMDMTIKYIVIVGDIAVNMLHSLKMRSVGRNRKKIKSLSGIIGFLFMRAKKFSEDVYSSMLCRGFNGSYVIKDANYELCIYDYIYSAVNILLIVGLVR